MVIDVFTSANINYIAKARVLAQSLKKYNPDARMHLMLSDKIPDWLEVNKEDFDSIITIDDLGLDDSWVFKHSVVELCTAVKPFCFQYILDKYSTDCVFYLDPDAVLFSTLDRLLANFETHSILLTPHVCKPETTKEAIVDNETSCLRHGIYNLGFLGVKNDLEGKKLVDWWAHRLTDFCQDNIPFGIFTDQRWMDFVPVYFEHVKILKEPIYNVATWNYSTRNVSGSIKDGILVDGEPICFHHFSGVDNGASVMMLEKYAKDMPVTWDMDKWYKQECDKKGQQEVVQHPWFYGFFDNGEKVDRNTRLLYRNNSDLQQEFKKPLNISIVGEKFQTSFYDWMKSSEINTTSHEMMPTKPFREYLLENQAMLTCYLEQTTKLSNPLKTIVQGVVRFLVKLLLKFVK